jgi:HSP20 family molecular chaperone IbpA
MAFIPKGFASEFAPMFRLLDDYASHSAARTNGFNRSLRSWQPRFDVMENKDNYTLQGEFPGIDQKDIDIAFTSENTLSIRGRTERTREAGTKPALTEGAANDANEESESGSYHKPTVESEDFETVTNVGSTSAETPAESTVAETQTEQAVTEASKSSGPRYWVSERSVGEFSRTFSFPTRVDQENVKASLKNGILSVVVPKAAAPENRKISIE